MGAVGGKGKGVCADSVCTGGNVDVVGGLAVGVGWWLVGCARNAASAAVRGGSGPANRIHSPGEREISLFFPLYVEREYYWRFSMFFPRF